MKSIRDHVVETMQPGVKHTPKSLAAALQCSYSSARTALIQLYYDRHLARDRDPRNGEYTYFLGEEAGGV